MDLEITDKTALVTGGSKGIGRAVALLLAQEGARVAIVARDKAALDRAATEIRDRTKREVVTIAANLSELAEVERVVETARERLGRIDVLVNNAGAIRGGNFLDIPDAQWAGDWNLKLLGYIRMARAVFPLMQAQGGGRLHARCVFGVDFEPMARAAVAAASALPSAPSPPRFPRMVVGTSRS